MPLPSEYRETLEEIEEEYGRQARKKAGTYMMKGMTPEEAMEELRKAGIVSSSGSPSSSNPGPEEEEKREFKPVGPVPQPAMVRVRSVELNLKDIKDELLEQKKLLRENAEILRDVGYERLATNLEQVGGNIEDTTIAELVQIRAALKEKID